MYNTHTIGKDICYNINTNIPSKISAENTASLFQSLPIVLETLAREIPNWLFCDSVYFQALSDSCTCSVNLDRNRRMCEATPSLRTCEIISLFGFTVYAHIISGAFSRAVIAKKLSNDNSRLAIHGPSAPPVCIAETTCL